MAGPNCGPGPVERARPGSKHHVLTDAQGIPLAVCLTAGNSSDITQLPLLDKVPPVAGRVGRLRRRPDALPADPGYGHDKYRRLLWRQRHPPGDRRTGSSAVAALARPVAPARTGLPVHAPTLRPRNTVLRKPDASARLNLTWENTRRPSWARDSAMGGPVTQVRTSNPSRTTRPANAAAPSLEVR
ncbi:transposase [Streptomyces massasporeus]|uniref:transposase n=1 Tax=Streptomyces massasporeus TaxID=67324 RepID=UPI00382A14C9